jgi:hypothetical protein
MASGENYWGAGLGIPLQSLYIFGTAQLLRSHHGAIRTNQLSLLSGGHPLFYEERNRTDMNEETINQANSRSVVWEDGRIPMSIHGFSCKNTKNTPQYVP